MGFWAYNGLSDEELNKQYTTSTGEHYTLRHNEALKVEMQYIGKGKNNANSQGWERDSSKYFSELYQNHPEMFSAKNAIRVQQKQAPIVDQKMIDNNPQWAQYRNQVLVHHHIGGDGEAVAVPQNAHKGSGEIHNAEKEIGITDKCKEFSNQCGKDPNSVGKTASSLHINDTRTSTESPQESDQNNTSPSNLDEPKAQSATLTRDSSVRSVADSTTDSSLNSERINSVESSMRSSSSSSNQSRSESVQNSMSSTEKTTSNETNSNSNMEGASISAQSSINNNVNQ